MRLASAEFADVVTGGSHRSTSRVDVLFNRTVIAEGIPITEGTVTYDRTAARLARLALTVADPLRLPLSADDILTPFGYELLVWRGVQIPTGGGEDHYLALRTDDYMTVPDETAFRVTGDLEMIWRCRLSSTTSIGTLLGKGFYSYEVTNYLSTFYLAINGVNQGNCSMANLGVSYGTTYWFRVTRNATTGAIDWYVQPDSPLMPTSWGTAKTDAGTQAAGAIVANSLPFTIAARPDIYGASYGGFADADFFDVIVKNAGTTVLEIRSRNLNERAFVASSGQVVTPHGFGVSLQPGYGYDTELLPLGVFPIQTSVVDGAVLLSHISADDRSKLVSDAKFEDDYQIAPGENYVTAIQDIIQDGVPDIECLFPSTVYETPRLTFAAKEDRWVKVQEMAKSFGHEILFDGLGRCVMRPEPTFTDAPVASVSEGVNMSKVSVTLSRATSFNRVIASGSNSSLTFVPRGVATDDNPASPTYYDGPFGRKPVFFSSEFIATDEQAVEAATAMLVSNLGVAQTVDLSAIPDPRLECSDVIQVTRGALGLDDLHIIDRLSIGLAANAEMTIGTRTQQVTA